MCYDPILDSDRETAAVEQVLTTAAADLLSAFGEDLDREGLRRTPQRMAKALAYLTRGSMMTMKDVLNGAIFTERYGQMVLVKDIEFYSLCKHHVLLSYRWSSLNDRSATRNP